MLDPDVSVLSLVGQASSVAWTAIDLTALTTATCRLAILNLRIQSNTYSSGHVRMFVRLAGGSHLIAPSIWGTLEAIAQKIHFAQVIVALDASQQFEYDINISGTSNSTFLITLAGYWP